LYRVTGCASDLAYPKVVYALSRDEHYGLANTEHTAITHLDGKLDRGLVIVRHWLREEAAFAYCLGIFETTDDLMDNHSLYRTDDGTFFTLNYRPPAISCADCVLAYYEDVKTGNDWCHIVTADGKVTNNDEILTPPWWG
jgi:hypothetical protein